MELHTSTVAHQGRRGGVHPIRTVYQSQNVTVAAMQMAEKKCVGASVVSRRDAAPVLEAAEHVLDAVTLAVEQLVVGQRGLAAFGGRDARGYAARGQRGAEAIAVVATIGEQFACWRQCGQHHRGAAVIAHLPFGEQQQEGPPLAVADGVQLGVQAAFGSPEATRKSPFWSRLAAVRCALR